MGNLFFNSKPVVDFCCTKPHWYEGRSVVLTIEDGTLSWEEVNTLNVDNQQLIIDKRESSQKHNNLICRCLKESGLYEDYLLSHIEKEYQQMLNRIDITVHKNDIKLFLRLFFKCIKL